MTQNNTLTYYALKVNGAIVSNPTTNAQLAENARSTLSESDQSSAVVVSVNQSGQELLLG